MLLLLLLLVVVVAVVVVVVDVLVGVIALVGVACSPFYRFLAIKFSVVLVRCLIVNPFVAVDFVSIPFWLYSSY